MSNETDWIGAANKFANTNPATDKEMIFWAAIQQLQANIAADKEESGEIIERSAKAAVSIIMKSVVDIISVDGHSWSDRPCQTCRAVSGLIGEPFGCYWYQEQKKKRKVSL